MQRSIHYIHTPTRLATCHSPISAKFKAYIYEFQRTDQSAGDCEVHRNVHCTCRESVPFDININAAASAALHRQAFSTLAPTVSSSTLTTPTKIVLPLNHSHGPLSGLPLRLVEYFASRDAKRTKRANALLFIIELIVLSSASRDNLVSARVPPHPSPPSRRSHKSRHPSRHIHVN